MGYLEFCSYCSKKNIFGKIDGNQRFYCPSCHTIHYENPKPTATLVCTREKSILLVKRAFNPGKGLWGLPGGFIEKGETPEIAAIRELKEETNLEGNVKEILGTCSHFNTIFGDILLIGMKMIIQEWTIIKAGDDAEAAKLFPLNDYPKVAFPCHEKMIQIYLHKKNNEHNKNKN